MSCTQFHCIKMFILRHAWLNLWDKHMTTGRINQVTTIKWDCRKVILDVPDRITLARTHPPHVSYDPQSHSQYRVRRQDKVSSWQIKLSETRVSSCISRSFAQRLLLNKWKQSADKTTAKEKVQRQYVLCSTNRLVVYHKLSSVSFLELFLKHLLYQTWMI